MEVGVLPSAGEAIADRYLVERTLGAGGMGVVVAATDKAIGRPVAIKFLRSKDHDSPEARARFIREAQSAGAIRSEHAVAIFDTGIHPPAIPYIVMEYLPGEDLSSLLKKKGALQMSEALDYVLQACEAIREAHALGIVHRDIKPSNLFVTKRSDGSDLIKVLDFGLSKPMSDQAQLTQSMVALGSPLYMSPEQIRSARRVDARSDIWSMGVVLYELLAGVPPFDGDTIPAVSAAIVTDPPRPLHEHGVSVPDELWAVLDAALAKNPEKRIQTIEELGELLAPFADDRRTSHRFASKAGKRSSSRLAFAATTEDTAPRRAATRRRWMAAGAAVVALGGLAGGGAMLMTRGSATTEAPAPTALADPSPAASTAVVTPPAVPTATPAPTGSAEILPGPPASATVAVRPVRDRTPVRTPSKTIPSPKPQAPAAAPVAVPATPTPVEPGQPPGRDRP